MAHLYGAPKRPSDITLADLQAHPIWLYSIGLGLPHEEDGPIGGDESSMRPWLGESNVTPDMDYALILLKVEDTDLWASAFFDSASNRLDAITVYGGDGAEPPESSRPKPGQPVTYVVVPRIGGKSGVKFTAKNRVRTDAFLQGSAEASVAATNKPAADDSAASQLQNNPELLDMVAAFFRSVGTDLKAKGYPFVLLFTAGHLEEEDPALYAELMKKCEGAGFSIPPISRSSFEGPTSQFEIIDGEVRDRATGGRLAFVVACNLIKEADSTYRVEAYWYHTEQDMHNLFCRVSLENGTWKCERVAPPQKK